jgi:hypothetical protein
MGTPINLEREFIRWFYEEPYPEVGSNRCQYQASGSAAVGVDVRDYWMRLAYKAGARRMAQDMLDTLADYACACEGLEPELMTPAQAFDRARENLFVYVTAALQKANA